MNAPDSAVIEVGKQYVKANPFRSRSTVICLACLATLCVIVVVMLKSGYFDGGFAAASIIMLREMSAHALNHQLRAEAYSNEKKPV